MEGRLGGQANVPGAAGTWKDLTGNVNLLAANLTTQVRAIAEVATAVTKGDLTRSIQVDARGEVAELKDNINTMIDNLRLTTDRNNEQDWLKTNLARFTGMLQGQRDLGTVGQHAAVRAGAAGQRAAGRHLPAGGRRRRCTCACWRATPTRRTQPTRARCRWARASSASAPSTSGASCVTTCPSDTVAVGPVFFDALPRSVVVFPVRVRGQDQGGAGARLARRVRAVAPGLPRAAHRQHRHRAQQHRGDDADRGAPEAVAAARGRAADAAEGAAADQRAAGAEGAAARRAERGGRAQEPRDRAGAARAGGEGRRAGPHLEVQVRVPGQHVARAAHAAQQHPDPGPAARRQPRAATSRPSRSSSRAPSTAPAPTC